MNTNTKATVLDNVDSLDMWTTTAITITASKFREGMVLMDPELGTPAVWLDHKQRSTRNSGTVKWLAHDLTTNRLTVVQITSSRAVSVLAA